MNFKETVIFCALLIETRFVLSIGLESDKTGYPSRSNDLKCTNNRCIMKCCPEENYLHPRYVAKLLTTKLKCETSNLTGNTLFEKLFLNKPNMSTFEINSGIYRTNKTFRTNSIDITDANNKFDFNIYLTENAELLLESPNEYDRWTRVPNDMYCADYVITNNGSYDNIKPIILVLFQNVPNENSHNTRLMVTGMLVSCFFLLLVLVVYSLLRELRNLCGLILMAYVTSLFGAFLFMAVMRMETYESNICLILTYLIYFFFMASFCWMNVMSYDIWWTFRGYAKARSINRRGERFKFQLYCLYACGLPLIMTIALAVLNKANLRHMPWFITPKIPSNSCFIKDGEKLLYLYMPMLILILCNWLFYIMTAYNVWRLSRGTAVLDSGAAGTPQAHRSNRRRFMVYLKLSVVMGLNWILEVTSYKYPDSSIWWISDFYNIFIGVAIFLIFVCKRKILRKLAKIFSSCKKAEWHPHQEHSSKSATSTCDSSTQDTNTVQMSTYPKGHSYTVNNF